MKEVIFPLFLVVSVFTGCSQKLQPLPLIPDAWNVGLLIMDGVYNTELTAPMDIFQHTQYRKGIKPMNVFTVAETDNIVTSFEGLRMVPDYDFSSAPHIDILVVPSAEHHLDSDLDNIVMIEWVKSISTNADYVTSHCDGSFVLAQAGLLNEVASTTFPSDIAAYKKKFPHLDVISEVIFVHDGKYITSVGGARSFDGALYLCEHLYGKEITERLAKGLVIDWKLEEVPHLVR